LKKGIKATGVRSSWITGKTGGRDEETIVWRIGGGKKKAGYGRGANHLTERRDQTRWQELAGGGKKEQGSGTEE